MGFSRSFLLGQYVERHSIIHRLDPRTKLAVLFLFMLSTTVLGDWLSYALAAAFVASAVFLSSLSPVYLAKGLKPVWLIVIATMLFHLLLTRGDRLWLGLGPIELYEEGATKAVRVGLKMILLLTAATLLTLTTKLTDFARGLEVLLAPAKKIGVPVQDLAMMLSLTLRFVPVLMGEADKIMKAQRARGANFASGPIVRRIQSYIAIVVPILMQAFQKAEASSLAIEARGYEPGQRRTPLRTLRFRRADGLAFVLSVLFIVAIVWM